MYSQVDVQGYFLWILDEEGQFWSNLSITVGEMVQGMWISRLGAEMKEQKSQSLQICIQILVSPSTSCVSLQKSLDLLAFGFLHYEMGVRYVENLDQYSVHTSARDTVFCHSRTGAWLSLNPGNLHPAAC